ncbi:MAG TPA: SDR family oxidoreductase [Haliangiales bacterium]|nr:SDR family oxidoreductase [Haliangiales bacterium]
MILVTGSTGWMGAAAVRELARSGTPVRALARHRAKAEALARLPGVEVVEGDMARPPTLGAVLDGVTRAFMISSSDERMVDTQGAFIDAARSAGVGHIIKMSGKESSIGFDPDKFRFVRMHGEIERALERSGVGWTHLRPSQFMQVYLREAATIAAEGAFYLPLDDVRLAPVDIEDIAKVAAALLTTEGHAGKTYEMTGPEALTMAEVAERLTRAIGKPVRYVNVSPEDMRRALLAAGVPAARVDALDELFAERRRRPQSRVVLATHEAFGVRPTPFEEFARRTAAAFRGETLATP